MGGEEYGSGATHHEMWVLGTWCVPPPLRLSLPFAPCDSPSPSQASTLDDDWGLRKAEMELTEESRRRKNYFACRKRRSELEAAEVRLGFLVNQVKGWSGEFDRLQSFTGERRVLRWWGRR